MFHNRTFKVLSNLILLAIFCTGQVAAAPNNSANDKDGINTSSLNSSISVNNISFLDFKFSQQALIVPSETIRVSVALDGTQANNFSSQFTSISADGRYVVFASEASNLVSGDTNGSKDVFVRDTIANATIRVSVNSSGEQGNSLSSYNSTPSISADGRYVVFESFASNLVSGDTNETGDVFAHDMQTGQTTRVSVNSSGVEGNGQSVSQSISADGRYVAFTSGANNLVSEDINSWGDVFVRDTQMNTTARVSVDSSGVEGNNQSRIPSISADGRYVAFLSYASNLVSGDTNDMGDAFVHDRQSGQTKRVSIASDSTEGNGEIADFVVSPSISADGRYVAFSSFSSNLVSGDTNETDDVFVRDIILNTTTRVSVNSSGIQGNYYYGSSYSPSISADGRYVAFSSDATNLVSGDTNGMGDVFVRDMQTNTTTRVSLDSSGVEGNNHSYTPSISADGRYIAFYSEASNLVSGDTNGAGDVFVHENGALPAVASVSGRVTDGSSNNIAGVSVSDGAGHTATTDSNGNYTLSGLAAGNYTITPSKSGYTFSPASRTVTVPPNSTGQDFTGTLISPTGKPPLILVHGFQGLNFSEGGYHCSNDGNGANDIVRFQRYDETHSNTTLKAKDDKLALADWLSLDYEVWIAHLETNPSRTDLLEGNGKCLRDQIETVWGENSQPITIVAHSMGGLVSWAAIRYLPSNITVKKLFTLGSPHAGIPLDVFRQLLSESGGCEKQTGMCQMDIEFMSLFFNRSNPNVKGVEYYFIGGSGGSGIMDELLRTSEGTNDGLVGQASAVGLRYPHMTFVPSEWAKESMPNQYWTNETHPAQSNPLKSYYVAPVGRAYSDAFECMKILMSGGSPDSQYCQKVNTQPNGVNSAQALGFSSTGLSFTETKNGHLNAAQSVTTPLTMDAAGSSSFYLTWGSGNAPSFTLTTPNSQIINPDYATDHPEQVIYETGQGSPETLPYAVYSFTSGQMGDWQLNITATDAIDYQAFGMMDSSRTLIVQTNVNAYQIGDTAAITATLENSGVGLTGATVTAKLTRPDSVVDNILLTGQGSGVYTADYVIPNSSGYLTIDITTSGTDSGTAFTRQNNLQVAIQSDNLQMTGVYSDIPIDNNSDSIYEYLDFTAEVNLAASGEYAVSAELYAGDQLITQAGDFFPLIAGTQTVTLSFDGHDINKSELDGPYSVKNLYFTPIDTGITAQSVETAWTTGAYSFSQFVDGISPVVSNIVRTNTNPSSAANINFTVTFSEPVTDVDATDFILTTTRLTGSSVISVTGSDSAYTIAVNTGTGNGTIRLDLVDNNTIADLEHNLLGGAGVSNGDFTSGQIYTIFKLATFADVPVSYWSSSSIERLYNAGISGGCTTVPVNYCPTTPVTRVQMAIFLLRGMHGSTYTPPAATGTKFADVPLGTFGAAWIEQLATEGITSGCGGGNYCPNTPVSRAQMAIFLVRAKHGSTFVPPAATGIFADVPIGSFGANFIEQLVTDAITSGCGNGNFCPNTMVKRDSMAVFLVKTFGLP